MSDRSRRAEELDNLSAEELGEIYKRCLLFIRRLIQARVIDGDDAEDIVQQAFIDIVTGTRNAPDEAVKFCTLMWQTVRSRSSHLWPKIERKAYLESLNGESSGIEQLSDSDAHDNHFVLKEQPVEKRLIEEQYISRVKALLGDDVQLIELVDLYIEDPDLRPSDIADELGIEVKDIYNMLKRLRRKLISIRDDHKIH